MAGDAGGGVCCIYYSRPTISDCTISGNSAGSGGGVYCGSFSEPLISACNVSGNSADLAGGGIYCASSPSIPTITECTVSGNSARFGGGVMCYEVGAIVTNCAISDNSATESGGGISSLSSVYSNSPTIANCMILGNSAGSGGGIVCSEGMTLSNCAISGNAALVVGGGVYCRLGESTMSNCTIVGNWAAYAGGGVYCDDYGGNPTIADTVLWSNGPDEISGLADVTYSDVDGGWPGEGNIDADPLFVDPDGPDDDPETWKDNNYRLSAGSPCIDSGCNGGVPPDTADID